MENDCVGVDAEKSGYFARQPVFDAQRKIWGFEMLYRKTGDAESAQFSDSDSATLSVIAGLSQSGELAFPRGKRILVNFGGKSILADAPLTFPPDSVIVEIPEYLPLDDPILEALERLRDAGYTLAVDDFEATPGKIPLYELASLFIVDVLGRREEDLRSLAAKARSYRSDCLMAVKKVESEEAFLAARRADYDLYQGYYFKRPEVIAGKTISAGEMSRLRLLRMLQSPEPDFPALATAIRSDPAISLKLLTFLNCPLFAFTTKVTSIERALTLLGWKQLKNWLRVVIFTDVTPSEKVQELAFLSVQRAKFIENAAQSMELSPLEVERRFILGLFSLLDAMMGVPMEEILGNIGLDEEIVQALTGGANALTYWLDACRAFESGDWAELDALFGRMGVAPADAAMWYAKSLEWTNSIFRYGVEPEAA